MSAVGESYTHGHHDSVVRSHRWRTLENSGAYLLGHLAQGMAVLDVGFGPGTITCDLAEAVSPGRVVGIDQASAVLTGTQAAGFGAVVPSASAWYFATDDDRAWWGGTWAERVTTSALAEQAIRRGVATAADLDDMAAAWRRWAKHPDGWFGIIHGEILCREESPIFAMPRVSA
jgi:hypothetical protein